MPTITQLEEQGRALINDQKALVEDTSRNWSEKRDEYDKREADIKSVLEQHRALKAVSGDPFNSGADTDAAQQRVAVKSIGEQVTDDASYQAAVAAKSVGARFSQSFDLKVAGNITEAGTGVGGVVPQYLPGVLPFLFKRLTVSDLLPQGTMNSASLIYVQETAVTNNAAAVAEGGTKPLSDLTLAQVTTTAKKIATVAKISDEMLQDVAYIQSYVNGRLTMFVQQAEEDQLLNGSGSGANITGILNTSGLTAAQALSTDTAPDAIYKEITKIRVGSFLEPDSIVINPANWQTIRLLKDANNQYYAGGPFNYGPYGVGSFSETSTLNRGGGDTLWGLNVVITPAIASGTALIGAFGPGAQVFRRTGLTVEMTNSNEDDFKTNLIAIRAEERLALAVYRPKAFGTVTGLL